MERAQRLKLLLDTHIWVWNLLQAERLSKRVRMALDKSDNEIWISPISTWEILNLCRKKRLTLEPNAPRWLASAFSKAPFKEATLTHEVALATEQVTLPHGDPADRFLAASARTYGLTLVTADENLLRGSGYHVLANR
jgi:PIN domain nuclease of toxin-antitoxin system